MSSGIYWLLNCCKRELSTLFKCWKARMTSEKERNLFDVNIYRTKRGSEFLAATTSVIYTYIHALI